MRNFFVYYTMEEYRKHPSLNIEVSNHGNVIGSSGSILNGSKDRYHRIGARCPITNKRRDYAVHRLVVETFIGPIPDGFVVNHIDGDKLNNHIDNLEAVTQKENNVHAIKTKLRVVPKGEACWNAYLKDEQILQIYEMIKYGHSNDYIAKQFLVSDTHIYSIRKGGRWKELFNIHLKEYIKSPILTKYKHIDRYYEILDFITSNEDKTNKFIADALNLEPSLVSRIRSRNQWKDVWGFYDRRATTIPGGEVH